MTENIEKFLPQRAPFIMIDELVSAEEKATVSRLTIMGSNILCGDNYFSEAGLLENMAQTAAAGTGYNNQANQKDISVGYIGLVKNFVIHDLPKIGETIETTTVMKGQIGSITMVEGSVECNGQLIATCEIRIFISN